MLINLLCAEMIKPVFEGDKILDSCVWKEITSIVLLGRAHRYVGRVAPKNVFEKACFRVVRF